jgi:hypothetical protein
MGTSSGTRDSPCPSSRATGSGRSAGRSRAAWLSRETALRNALPAAARCAGLSGSGGVVARRTAVRAVAGRAGRAVDGAGLAVVRTGLAVEPAGLAADRAGLAVEPAGLAADRAGLAADRAGLAADRAGLAVEPAGLAVELADVAADRAFGFAGVAADGFAAGAAADRARGLAGVAADGFAAGAAADRARGLAGVAADSAGGGVFDAAADCGLDPAAGRPVCRAWPPVRAWGMAPPCSVVASHLLTRPPCVVTHPG